MASIFVENCSHAAVGTICDDGLAFEIVTIAGQGDASRFFLSVGDDVERRTGCRFTAERLMNVLASSVALVTIAQRTSPRATIDQLADLACFFAGRIRHMEPAILLRPATKKVAPLFTITPELTAWVEVLQAELHTAMEAAFQSYLTARPS